MFRITNHTIIKTSTDRNQHITVLHRHIRFVCAVHTGHADEFVVSCSVTTQTHQGIGDGETQLINQFIQFWCSIRQDHAAAGVNHGALGLQQQLNRFTNLSCVPFIHWAI